MGRPCDRDLTIDDGDPDFVDDRLPPGLDENRGFEDDRALGLVFERHADFGLRHCSDGGPHDVGKPLQRIGVAEHFATEDFSVDFSVGPDGVFSEGFDDLVEPGAAFLIGAVAELVGINDAGAPFAEKTSSG